jgi:putative DNA primase/helicase
MDFKPQRFSAWSPKALGTIKILPGTLADRAIIIPMSRKRPGDVVARVLSTDNAHFARLRSQCLRWSEDHATELKGADPSLPKSLDDRAADNWRPLKAIADALGDRWSKLCADAAEMLSRERGEDETTGVALLVALKAIFAEGAAEIFDRQGKPDGKAMHTDAILPKLHDADARWKEYGRSEKPITDKGLARLLKGFRIKATSMRIGGIQKRGYRVSDFGDAFGRYCPSSGCDFCGEGERPDDPLLTSYDGESSVLLHRSCWPSWAAAAGRS